MKLSTKLTFIFSGIMLLMGTVSFYGIYSFQNDILVKEISGKLEHGAIRHLDQLDRIFFERLNELEVLSEAPDISSRNSKPARIQSTLEKFLHRHPDFASLSYFDMNRTRVASAGSTKKVGAQHSLSEYWPAVYRGADKIVDISTSESLEVPTVHLVKRVADGNGTFALLVVRMPVEGLYDWLEVNKITGSDHEKYKVVLMDKNGLVLYSNYDKKSILHARDDDFEIIENKLSSAGTADTTDSASNQNYLIEKHGDRSEILVLAKERGYRDYKGNDWILKIEVATEDAFAPVAALGKKALFLLGTLGAVSAFAMAYALLFMVVWPLEKLSNATDRLSEGNLDIKVAVESNDEIGKLAESFNLMTANLKSAREELARTADMAMIRACVAERKIINISEETQQRIGQELHDDLGQQLTGIAFMSEVLFQNLKSQDHPDFMEAARITVLINEAVLKTRKLAYGLYPVELKGAGLPAMLREFAGDVESIYGVRCDFVCDESLRLDDLIADPDVAIHLYRIVQESVNNAIKHGAATKIVIHLILTPTLVTLQISDNGRGIGDLSDTGAGAGLGMRTMQYRASLIGAAIRITSRPEEGASVILTLPVKHDIRRNT